MFYQYKLSLVTCLKQYVLKLSLRPITKKNNCVNTCLDKEVFKTSSRDLQIVIWKQRQKMLQQYDFFWTGSLRINLSSPYNQKY